MRLTKISRSVPSGRTVRRGILRAALGVAPLLALAISPAVHIGSANAATGVGSVGSVTDGVMTKVGVVNPRALPTRAASQSTSAPTHSIPIRFPYKNSIHPNASHAVPSASNTPFNAASASILHNFLGITGVDSQRVNGYDVEPPDQGLCVGPASAAGPSSELELVNLAATLYSSTGQVFAGPISLNQFFGETSGFTSTFTSDPRCYYDPNAQAFFATVLVIGPGNTSHFDVAVNPTSDPVAPYTIYKFDTTDASNPNCPCFGDQPLLGVDAHGVFVSTNEFAINTNYFGGAQVYAISKAQLLAGARSPHIVHYGHLMIGGGTAASLQPAMTPGASPAEYFLNSLDFNATIDNRLGVWALTNDQVLDTNGRPTLSSVLIQSELYGQPPNAVQKGSSATLNTDDDRMQQVQNLNGTLHSSLDSVGLIKGDSESRAVAAWFNVVPTVSSGSVPKITGATIAAQGYVASKGNYLLYPAVEANNAGNAVMVMTLSGANVYPSAVYASGSRFSVLKTAAPGTGPDMGFTCLPQYGGPPCRWGDYSAAVMDPSSGNLWLATEYIAGPADQFVNWATRVFEVKP